MNRTILQSPNKQFAILQISKNASTSTEKMFKKIGWKRTIQIAESAKIIAALQDPMIRWMKGMIEFCSGNHIDIKDWFESDYSKLLLGFYDNHTAPISLLYHDIFDKITFLPLDHPTLNFSEVVNIETNLIIKDVYLHTADNEKKELQEYVFKKLLELDASASEWRKMSEFLKFDIDAYNKMKLHWNYGDKNG